MKSIVVGEEGKKVDWKSALGVDLDMQDQIGAAAWLYTQHANKFQTAASKKPLPGVAHLWMPLVQPITIFTFPLAPLLKDGISLGNEWTYFEQVAIH
jgi:hypothetical protein